MKTNEITLKIIEAAIAVHRQLGPGLLESVYEAVLAYELTQSGLVCERQKGIEIVYQTLVLPNAFKADLVVNGVVIVELKSVESLEKVHFKQLQTYLKLSGRTVGLLINFNEVLLRDGVHRIVHGFKEGE